VIPLASANAVLRQMIQEHLHRPLLFTDIAGSQTYRDLLLLAEEFAAAFADAGAARGDVVLLRFSRTSWPAYVAAYMACALGDLVPAVTAMEKGTEVADHLLEALPVRCSVRPANESALGLSDCVLTVHHPSPAARRPPAGGEYLTTSGTSGRPKIVAVSEQRLLAAARSPARRRVLLQTTPPGTNASQTAMQEALFNGGALACLSQWDPRRFHDLVEQSGADTALLAPSLTRTLLRAPSFDPGRLRTLRSLRLGMAPVPPSLLSDLRERLPHVRVSNIYTTTEAWPAGTVMRYGEMDASTVGVPLPGTRVRIVDGSGVAVPQGTTGGIQLAYTEAGAWVDTGDVGRLDATGHLVHLGRSYDMVTAGGELLSLRSVEHAALASDLVSDACAFPVEGAAGPAVALAVVWAGPPAETAIRQLVADRLGRSATPRTVHTVPSLPRDAQGKIRRLDVERLALACGPRGARCDDT
jgi:acyl-CoA synthetase (AMP-forming)/AMP-acid ligase II